MKATEPVYSILLNWNSPADTLACIQSLLAAGAELSQVIVVDNASQDDSVVQLRAAFGEVLPILENQRNLGFAGGMNVGIEHALALGATWVLILNNDTLVHPLFFTALLAPCETAEYELRAPIIYYQHDPDRVWFLGDQLIPRTLLTFSQHKNRKIQKTLPRCLPVDFVTGCGMLVHQAVFEKIGLFDPTLFMYAEDADFCWRAREAGFRAACLTQAHMWHKVSASANRVRPQAHYWRIGNQIKFYRKHARGWQTLGLRLFTLGRVVAQSVGNVARGQSELVSAAWRAWRDGWFGHVTSP